MVLQDPKNDKTHKLYRGLLSGWRCTTWINSLLNVIYNRIAMDNLDKVNNKGKKLIKQMKTGGDDISNVVQSYSAGLKLWDVMTKMGLELKPIKQFISNYRAEFFRVDVCIDKD